MPDTDLDPDSPPPPARPKTPEGCWIVGGLFFMGAVGFASAVAAAFVLNVPNWAVPTIMFGVPGLYLAAVVVRGVRRARADAAGQKLTAEQRLILPFAGAFVAVGLLSLVGAGVALALGAPGWATPIIFFAPPVILTAFTWKHLKTLPERMKRAAPSPEKAAVVAPKPSHVVELASHTYDPGAFPTVPTDDSEPGKRLARNLPSADLPAGCACLGALGFTAFWNGIVSVFVWQAVKGFQNGKPEWFLVVFLIPFAIVGLVAVAVTLFTAANWVVAMLAGKLTVEVDDHPFVPGGRYRGYVAQRGLFRVTDVGVELVCSESATYTAGTTESTDTHVAASHPAEIVDATGTPLDFALVVPLDAMHSFEATKNKIEWTVRVNGRVLGVLPIARSYEALVRPGGGDV